MVGETQEKLHALGDINGNLHFLLSNRLQTQRSKFSGQISTDEYLLSLVSTSQRVFWWSLQHNLHVNSHFHLEFFLSSYHSCRSFSQLPRIRSSASRPGEYVHSKQMEIDSILAFPVGNDSPASFLGLALLVRVCFHDPGGDIQRKDEHLHFR